jgi:hypothetical protein
VIGRILDGIADLPVYPFCAVVMLTAYGSIALAVAVIVAIIGKAN